MTARSRVRDWGSSALGERVLHICELRGWSLNRLGEEAGIASGPMSRLGRRREVIASGPETLARIADAAGVSVLWLMLGRGPVSTEPRDARALCTRPNWITALAEAKKRQIGIPNEFWELAGECTLQVPLLDWQLIAGLAREAYSAHQRALDTADI